MRRIENTDAGAGIHWPSVAGDERSYVDEGRNAESRLYTKLSGVQDAGVSIRTISKCAVAVNSAAVQYKCHISWVSGSVS